MKTLHGPRTETLAFLSTLETEKRRLSPLERVSTVFCYLLASRSHPLKLQMQQRKDMKKETAAKK
jgi:hypothetical protein